MVDIIFVYGSLWLIGFTSVTPPSGTYELHAISACQLLMLSGIGDEEELKSNNLGCVSHAPELGKNLQVRSEWLLFPSIDVEPQ